jgi:hypothetical protein
VRRHGDRPGAFRGGQPGRPTSCAFGDTGGGTLFVTTARDGLDEAALAWQPDAGRLLRLDSLGVTWAALSALPRVRGGRLGSGHGGSFCRSTALAATWPVVTASYIPLLAVILAHLLGASPSAAANVGLAVAIVLLMSYAWSGC